MTSPRDTLYDQILLAYDIAISKGAVIPEPWKRRDPKEPGQRVKSQAEDALFSIMMQYFRRTKKRVRVFFEERFPDRKVLEIPTEIVALFEDERFAAALLLWLTAAADSGILLFELEIGFGIGAAANVAAAEWARLHAGELIKLVTDYQLKVVREAVSTFIDTPGMTIGDVVNRLVGDKLFDDARAMRIAVSEVTDAFAEAELIGGRQLQIEFPDVPVHKTWWTNNDAIVRECPICWPLHGVEVPLNETFVNRDLNLEFDRPKAHPNGRCWITIRTRIDLVQ